MHVLVQKNLRRKHYLVWRTNLQVLSTCSLYPCSHTICLQIQLQFLMWWGLSFLEYVDGIEEIESLDRHFPIQEQLGKSWWYFLCNKLVPVHSANEFFVQCLWDFKSWILSEVFQVLDPLYTCIPVFFLLAKDLAKFWPEKYDFDLYKGVFMYKWPKFARFLW